MLSLKIHGRRIIAFLLPIFLFACCPPDSAWEFHHVFGCHPSFKSSQLLFKRRTVMDVVEMEIVKGTSGIRTYINLHFCPIDADCEDGTVTLTYRFADQEGTTQALVLEGRQRLLIPPEAAASMINALMLGTSVNISVGMYEATIPASNFPYLYYKMSNYKSYSD